VSIDSHESDDPFDLSSGIKYSFQKELFSAFGLAVGMNDDANDFRLLFQVQ